jgi:hypothetical protein
MARRLNPRGTLNRLDFIQHVRRLAVTIEREFEAELLLEYF